MATTGSKTISTAIDAIDIIIGLNLSFKIEIKTTIEDITQAIAITL